MKYECGPSYDRRIIDFSLPKYPKNIQTNASNLYCKLHDIKKNYKIGVLVSGGIDSALLYYILLKENQSLQEQFTITPYTILRKEGSKNYALKVINYINCLFNQPYISLNVVGNPNLPEIQQVESGAIEVLKENDFLYIGIIEAKPEHSVNWVRHKFIESYRRKYPFMNLQKSHIIDLFYLLNVEGILPLTHSCAVNELTPCLECNGCKEREWGFLEIKK